MADVHDRRTRNRAQIGALAYVFFHLGMLGHGAYLPEADRDIAVIPVVERGSVVTKPAVMTTNASFYTLPDWVDEVPGFDDDYRKIDSLDGSLDDRWRGHDLSDPSHARHSPVWALYETRLLLELLDREEFGGDDVPDLFYVNYKQIDDAGHNWNMLNPEMGDTLKYTDLGLRDLVEFLNDTVGKRKWVLALTADHGQAPDPLTIGAWPIKMKVFTGAIAEHFGVEASELFLDHRPVGLWLDRDFAASRGISPSEVADFIIGMRIEGNIREGEESPQKYDDRMDELLFAAAWPSAQTDAVWRCVTRRGRS